MKLLIKYSVLFTLLIAGFSCDTERDFQLEGKAYYVKFYGEDGDHEGVDFVMDSQGNIILLGNFMPQGGALNQQIYLVKVNSDGIVIWQKTFGSAGNDIAKDIELTNDGNLIVAAETEKGLDDKDVYLLKISVDGVALDSVRVGLKTLGNQEANEEVNSVSVIQNGFLVAGSTTAVTEITAGNNKDAMHLKFTSSLDLIDASTGLWKNTHSKNDAEDVLIKVMQINDSLYYCFGYSNTVRDVINNNYKYWIFSINGVGESNNDEIVILDFLSSPDDFKMTDATLTHNDFGLKEFALCGLKKKVTNESQSYLIKLQENPFPNGVISQETPTDLGVGVDGVVRLANLQTGGFLMLSNSRQSTGSPSNISLIKLSKTFSKMWTAPILFGGEGDDFAGNVMELPDGKILVIGTMTLGGGQTKMALLKLNQNGKFDL